MRVLGERDLSAVPGTAQEGASKLLWYPQTYRAEVLPAPPVITRTLGTGKQAAASPPHQSNHTIPIDLTLHLSSLHPFLFPPSAILCTQNFFLSPSVWGHLSGISRILPGSKKPSSCCRKQETQALTDELGLGQAETG